MAKNTNYVSHKKSKLKNQDGSPQLPSASVLVEGEIAINFAENVETLSIKNESGTVVTFSSDNYYTEQKLGSGFTGANSAVTVTDVIEENEEIISAALTDLDERKLDASAYTPSVELWEAGSGANSVVLKNSSGTASGDFAVAEGNSTTASGNYSHAEGSHTIASGTSSHAEGNSTIVTGTYGHAEGNNAKAFGNYGSHAEGDSTIANGESSHAEGLNTKASGGKSHAEGDNTVASGTSSHAEGVNTRAVGDYSHAEGQQASATSYASHAEGYQTLANADNSHAEGNGTIASGFSSHAEGTNTKAFGYYSHAEGYSTSATNYYSHAEGNATITNNQSEHASGQYNVSNSATTTFGNSGNTLFSVGNGSYNARHNAFEIRQNGDIYIVSGNSDIKLQDYIGGSIEVDQVLDDTTSASTNPVSSKAVYEAMTDNKLVWTNAYVAMSGIVSAHTASTEIHLVNGDRAKLNSITGAFGTMAYEDKTSYSSATEVNTALNGLNGKMVAEIESSNGSITASTSTRSDGSVKADIQTDASKISGLTAVSDSDEGAAKISGVTTTDSIRKGVENIYKSLASEIAARKAAFLARTISSANKGITVTETPNADGYNTTLALTLDASTNGSGKEKLGNDNALTITDNGLFLSSIWTCGEYDN